MAEIQSTETEVWKQVLGYEGIYSVSSFGRVRGDTRFGAKGRWKPERILSPCKLPTGYLFVMLYKDGKGRHERVHRLVCSAFHGPSPEAKTDCNHLDGQRDNNLASNLEWCTRSENMLHATQVRGVNMNPRPQHGSDRYCAKLDEDKVREIRLIADSGAHTHKEIAAMYGVSRPVVTKAIRRENWKHVI